MIRPKGKFVAAAKDGAPNQEANAGDPHGNNEKELKKLHQTRRNV